jgi:septal ring factor EnvC (AmiA/AmiB activator)
MDHRSESRHRLAEVLGQLEALRERRAGLSPSDLEEMFDLREQMNSLEAEASQLRGQLREPSSLDQARADLADVERRLSALGDARIDVVKQAGGGSAGGDFGFATEAHRLNEQIDVATGRADLLRRRRDLQEWIGRNE